MRSATETVMKAMECFGQAEPEDCLIVWTDESGDLCWSCTTDSIVTKIGLVESMRTILKKQLLTDE